MMSTDNPGHSIFDGFRRLTRARWRSQRRAQVYIIEECPRAAEFGLSEARVRAENAQEKAASKARMRIGLCGAAFIAAFGVLVFRLWLITGGLVPIAAVLLADNQEERARPEIFDRHGRLLATNLPMRNLNVTARDVWDAADTAAAIARILPDVDQARIENTLASGRSVHLARNLTPAQEKAIFDLGLPGVNFSSSTERFYPHAHLAGHLIGYTVPGRGGVAGLEKVMNAADEPLVTSIDLRAQQILTQELGASVARFKAEAGWGAVMDVATGEILALANYPDFDIQHAAGADDAARRNLFVHDRYELGSAFKVFTAAGLINAGLADEHATFDARGGYRVADRVIRDFHGENRVLTLGEVLRYSSNIGAARMSVMLGPEALRDFLGSLGLLEPVDHILPEKRAPELPLKWGPVEAATVSYGHGISVTPMHLLTAFSAIVNGGIYRTPVFTKVDPAHDDLTGRRVITEETSATMRRLLRQVILAGTSGQAEADGYYPIGKTATADKVDRQNGGYFRDQRISSFIGAFPGNAPRYAILVSLDNPKPVAGTHGYATAGWNAAPLFGTLVSQLAPLFGVLPQSADEAGPAFANPPEADDPAPAKLAANAVPAARQRSQPEPRAPSQDAINAPESRRRDDPIRDQLLREGLR